MDEVQTTLRSKKLLSKLKVLKVNDSGKGLSALRGRCENGGNQKGNRSESKYKSKFFG